MPPSVDHYVMSCVCKTPSKWLRGHWRIAAGDAHANRGASDTREANDPADIRRPRRQRGSLRPEVWRGPLLLLQWLGLSRTIRQHVDDSTSGAWVQRAVHRRALA